MPVQAKNYFKEEKQLNSPIAITILVRKERKLCVSVPSGHLASER
jgi:hypothetical protein